MTAVHRTRLHHVANGTATTALLERAAVPGTRSIWADPLHDGPVPAGPSDLELIAVRAAHLAAGNGSSVAEIRAELARWRTAIDDASPYDELVLWYEHDLFDQLNLIQVLDRIRASAASARSVTLICIGAFPGHPDFRGLGELSPAEIETLLATRAPVTEPQLALATRAWNAFRAPDPREIERLLEADTSPLPFLGPALRRHLEELPWTIDGLSRTERRILELAPEAPVDLWTAFHRVSEGETAFHVADLSFWRIVNGLRTAVPALVDVRVSAEGGATLPRGTIALTDTGLAVLGGAVDRIARCGIDRWLGGVHLDGRGPVWRFDGGTRRVVYR
jgi:hypothetical protein